MVKDFNYELIGNVELVKQLNSAIVYRILYQRGPISRIQIAELSHLAPASITKITRQFLERGLIRETEHQASTGGRPAISLEIEFSSFQAIAIRLGRNNLTLTLYNLDGTQLKEKDLFVLETEQAGLEQGLLTEIAQFIHKNRGMIKELIAISVTLPGLVDTEKGIVTYMPNIPIHRWHLRDVLQKQFNVMAFVGHNIRSLALAEHYFGQTKQCEDSLLIRIDTGVGAGIIMNKKIFTGKKYNLGEIGHIQIDPMGERCECGNFGCVETFISNQAIEHHFKQLLQQGHPSSVSLEELSALTISLAATQGDHLAIEMIELVGQHLGKVIAIAINLFNPEKVVISGDIIQAKQILLTTLQKSVNTQSLKNFHEHIAITTSALDHTSAIGAFALVKEAMLNGSLIQYLLEYSSTMTIKSRVVSR